jgi:hypothetical protein
MRLYEAVGAGPRSYGRHPLTADVGFSYSSKDHSWFAQESMLIGAASVLNQVSSSNPALRAAPFGRYQSWASRSLPDERDLTHTNREKKWDDSFGTG